MREGEDPLSELVKLSDNYLIDRIVGHSFNPPEVRIKKNLCLKILWTGYPEPEETPYNKSLLKTVAFLDYAEQHPELLQFVPKGLSRVSL